MNLVSSTAQGREHRAEGKTKRFQKMKDCAIVKANVLIWSVAVGYMLQTAGDRGCVTARAEGICDTLHLQNAYKLWKKGMGSCAAGK